MYMIILNLLCVYLSWAAHSDLVDYAMTLPHEEIVAMLNCADDGASYSSMLGTSNVSSTFDARAEGIDARAEGIDRERITDYALSLPFDALSALVNHVDGTLSAPSRGSREARRKTAEAFPAGMERPTKLARLSAKRRSRFSKSEKMILISIIKEYGVLSTKLIHSRIPWRLKPDHVRTHAKTPLFRRFAMRNGLTGEQVESAIEKGYLPRYSARDRRDPELLAAVRAREFDYKRIPMRTRMSIYSARAYARSPKFREYAEARGVGVKEIEDAIKAGIVAPGQDVEPEFYTPDHHQFATEGTLDAREGADNDLGRKQSPSSSRQTLTLSTHCYCPGDFQEEEDLVLIKLIREGIVSRENSFLPELRFRDIKLT